MSVAQWTPLPSLQSDWLGRKRGLRSYNLIGRCCTKMRSVEMVDYKCG
eukprot:COSAG01_NODE_686_length_14245_cov_95.096140_13_plen_48_part_00